MAQSASFLSSFFIFLAIIQLLQTRYVWHCTDASYKEIAKVPKFEGFSGSDSWSVVIFSECSMD